MSIGIGFFENAKHMKDKLHSDAQIAAHVPGAARFLATAAGAPALAEVLKKGSRVVSRATK